VAGCCECGDEPSGSGATELVSYLSAVKTRPVFYTEVFNTSDTQLLLT
jgi:hypothetical protein